MKLPPGNNCTPESVNEIVPLTVGAVPLETPKSTAKLVTVNVAPVTLMISFEKDAGSVSLIVKLPTVKPSVVTTKLFRVKLGKDVNSGEVTVTLPALNIV